MGEYYEAINLDKRESLLLGKLDEFLLMDNHTAELAALVTVPSWDMPLIYDPRTGHGVFGRWAGDRIAIVGEYNQPPELTAAKNEYADISGLVSHAIEARRREDDDFQERQARQREGVELRLRIGDHDNGAH